MTLKIDCWSSNPPAAPCDFYWESYDAFEWGILVAVLALACWIAWLWRPRA